MAVSISISITQNSQSIANNKSNVTVKVTAKWTGGSYNAVVDASGTPQAKGWCKIDGTTYDFASTFNTGKTTSGSQVIYTKKLDIAHADNGTKTLSVSASYSTGVSSGTVTASASKVLTTIPRKSTLTVANGTLGTEQSLTITEKASSFTHKLYYTCGSVGATYIIGSSSGASAVLPTAWKPPIDLAAQNKAGTTVTITFTLVTYNGSTNVGSNTYTRTYTIPASVKPSCSISVADAAGHFATYGAYIKGQSKFRVVISPTTAYGSDIASYSTTANGVKYTTSSFTTGVLAASSGSMDIITTVKDKRGRSGTAEKTVSVLDYALPQISLFKVKRCVSLTDGTEDIGGEFCQVTFSAAVTSLNSKNTARYVLQYKKTADAWDKATSVELTDYSGTYTVTEGVHRFAADSGSSYNVRLLVHDNFTGDNPEANTTVLSTGEVIEHWRADGKGLGFGKIGEIENGADFGYVIRAFGGFKNILLDPETDLNTVLKPNTYYGENVATYNYGNCPITSGTFTLDVASAGDVGQVRQRLETCHKTEARTFERFYYGGAWGGWVCVSDYGNKLLWQGGYYMTAGHTVTLAEPVSAQPTGIVLVFSEFVDGAAVDQNYHEELIPKRLVALKSGADHCVQMMTNGGGYFATKRLFIYDDKIVGDEGNNRTFTGTCGITCTNNRFVLRYVIGV